MINLAIGILETEFRISRHYSNTGPKMYCYSHGGYFFQKLDRKCTNVSIIHIPD